MKMKKNAEKSKFERMSKAMRAMVVQYLLDAGVTNSHDIMKVLGGIKPKSVMSIAAYKAWDKMGGFKAPIAPTSHC